MRPENEENLSTSGAACPPPVQILKHEDNLEFITLFAITIRRKQISHSDMLPIRVVKFCKI